MLLSRLFLRSRYRPLHLAGVALCIAGLCLTVLSDRIVPSKDTNTNNANNDNDDDTYPHALLGDMLCLVGAALYAASNVMQEALVKAHDRAEFLGMLGAYGAALSFMQVGLSCRLWEFGGGVVEGSGVEKEEVPPPPPPCLPLTLPTI